MLGRALFNIHLQKGESRKQNIGCQYLRFGSHLSELGSHGSTCVRTRLTVLQKDITTRPFPGGVLPRILDRGVPRRFVNPNPI